MKARYLSVAAIALLLGTSAFADTTQCTAARSDAWMTQSDMLRKLVDGGYTIERFAVTQGNCYQMHGWDKQGNRVRIDHDPVDGKVVKMKLSAEKA